jgi:hypothetical protein
MSRGKVNFNKTRQYLNVTTPSNKCCCVMENKILPESVVKLSVNFTQPLNISRIKV